MKHLVFSDDKILAFARSIEAGTIDAVLHMEQESQSVKGAQSSDGHHVSAKDALVLHSYPYHALTEAVYNVLRWNKKDEVLRLIELLDELLGKGGAGIHSTSRNMLAAAKERL